jgi:hypothetical protein
MRRGGGKAAQRQGHKEGEGQAVPGVIDCCGCFWDGAIIVGNARVIFCDSVSYDGLWRQTRTHDRGTTGQREEQRHSETETGTDVS